MTVAGSVNSPVIPGQKQGNKSGLMLVQDPSAGQGQGGQLRTSLPSDHPSHGGHSGPVRPVGVPGALASAHGAQSGTRAPVLD